MIKLLGSIAREAFGLFVDDGALAALCVGLIACVTILVLGLSLPPLLGGLALLLGCIAILGWSIARASSRH